MEKVLKLINNLAVSVFAVIVGLKMWFASEGIATVLALLIIIMGVSALENNIFSILKERRGQETERAGRSDTV
jgi:hypothetical protein